MKSIEGPKLGRRAFLCGTTLVLTASPTTASETHAEQLPESPEDGIRFGLVTDLHYADKPPAGSRNYRRTLDKFREAAERFQSEQPAFLVELGDLIDRADSVSSELEYLKTINEIYTSIGDDRHYVLGNHCVDTLHKHEFLEAVGQKKSFYSFDRGECHFIVLDSCYRHDGEPYGRRNFQWTDANVPPDEIEWLKSDLMATKRPSIVFAHQRLDVAKNHSVRNHNEVRRVLESAGNVRAVFQGHSHKNDLSEINGIHYCTLVAMVEGNSESNNAYSIVNVAADGTIVVKGFRKQADYRWPDGV